MAPRLGTRARRQTRSSPQVAPPLQAPDASSIASNSSLLPVPSQPSPFFNLPLELRDMIYADVWKQEPSFVVRYGSQSFQVSYRGGVASSSSTAPDLDNANTNTLPDWMLANKQMYQEAMEELQHRSDWALLPSIQEPIKNGQWNFQFIPKAHVPSPLHNKRFTLSPWHAYSLDMGTFPMREYLQLASDGRTLCSQIHLPISNGGTNLLRDLRAHVPANARLRHLSLALSDSSFDHGTFPTEAESALGVLNLAALPGLDSVFIKVNLYRFLNVEILRDTVLRDVERLGVEMVGGTQGLGVVDMEAEVGRGEWRFTFKKA